MDPRLIYWTWALLNMALAAVCALEGMRRIRRGERVMHRRLMVTAASLVGIFLLSYLLKVALLGKEDLASWGDFSVMLLHLHEVCVATMLVGGAYAGWLAYRMRAPTEHAGEDGSRSHGTRFRHRHAGRVAVVGIVLGVLSATLVLRDMYRRDLAAQEVRLGAVAPVALQVGDELPDER